MPIGKLPTEIVAHTFQLLELKSIVCQLFRKTIDSSAAIQYEIELRASCALDGPPSTAVKAQRLHDLRRLNQSWKHLKWAESVLEIPIRNYAAVYELSNGFFVQDVNHDFPFGPGDKSSTLKWMMLPSRGAMEAQEWKKCSFDFRVADLCLDVDRDLLVVVERADAPHQHAGEITYTLTCRLHLRSLSSNGPHPSAENHIIQVSFNAESNDYAMIVQLSGDHLGLLLSTRHNRHARNDRFFLWDWTAAVCKGDEAPKEGQWDTFCFLSHDTVLVPDTAAGRLNVYTFTPAALSFRHRVSLGLPETRQDSPIVQITARTEPPSRTPHSGRARDTQRAFSADPDAAIVVLTLDYVVPPADGEDIVVAGFHINVAQPQMLVVHRTSFLLLAQKHGTGRAEDGAVKLIDWDGWGAEYSRWGVGPCPPRWVCYVHGTRYVSMHDRPFGPHRPVAISVYDFNIKNAVRDLPHPSSVVAAAVPGDDADLEEEQAEHVKKAYNVLTQSEIYLPRIFKKPIVTRLPYRVVETEEIFDWDSVMIDDERIIGLKEETDELGLESLDVLVL